MACALVLLCSMGQVDNTHSTTVRTVYAGVFPTRHTEYPACVCRRPTIPSHSDKREGQVECPPMETGEKAWLGLWTASG
jgi:hypothetical protein